MSADHPSDPATGRTHARPPSWPLTAAAAGVLGLAGGWFLWSWGIQHNPAGDAFGESLGVALGLLVAASAIGALLGRRRDTG
jgi:drug/metabolite transporter (DMT)-like permease